MTKQFNPSLRFVATALACGAALASAYAQASNYYAVLPLAGVDATQSSRPVRLALAAVTPPLAYVGIPYSFNLGALVSLDGPEGTDGSKVAWSIFSGELPAGLALVGSTISGTPTAVSAPTAVKLRAEYAQGFQSVGAMQGYQFEVSASGVRDFGAYRAWADGTYAQSCEGYIRPKDANHAYKDATGDGVYRISPPSSAPFDAYCDQTSDGGGWTRVALQFESNPVAWTGAESGPSYTLSQAQIPPHTFTGFGKDGVATYAGMAPFQYTTEDIPVTLVQDPRNGWYFQIHRSSISHYAYHNPEEPEITNQPEWRNTLTFDKTGARAFSWAFSLNNPIQAARGYSLGGSSLYTTPQDYGWSVWVK